MSYPLEQIHEQVQRVQTCIRAACQRSGRDEQAVSLIAVSKFQPAEAVLAAYRAGVRHFGENRVEEAHPKMAQVNAQLAPQPSWHMIGHVQSRKAKQVAGEFALVQSVDSTKLARKLAEQAQVLGIRQSILLEVNVSGEASKEGFQAFDWQNQPSIKSVLWQEIEALMQVEGLSIQGLMTMAPYELAPEATRPVFASLRALRDALQHDLNLPLPDLSMGMTNDYEVAIEEGATMVRVGRAIFGERQYV
jgi:pyridoxal phosphate enzyme (YggS family)